MYIIRMHDLFFVIESMFETKDRSKVSGRIEILSWRRDINIPRNMQTARS